MIKETTSSHRSDLSAAKTDNLIFHDNGRRGCGAHFLCVILSGKTCREIGGCGAWKNIYFCFSVKMSIFATWIICKNLA